MLNVLLYCRHVGPILGVKTCDVFLCFVTIVVLLSIVFSLLFFLCYQDNPHVEWEYLSGFAMRSAVSFLSHGNITSLNTLCFEKNYDAVGKKGDSYANYSFPYLSHGLLK